VWFARTIVRDSYTKAKNQFPEIEIELLYNKTLYFAAKELTEIFKKKYKPSEDEREAVSGLLNDIEKGLTPENVRKNLTERVGKIETGWGIFDFVGPVYTVFLEILLKRKSVLNEMTLKNAAKSGCVDAVKYLLKTQYENSTLPNKNFNEAIEIATRQLNKFTNVNDEYRRYKSILELLSSKPNNKEQAFLNDYNQQIGSGHNPAAPSVTAAPSSSAQEPQQKSAEASSSEGVAQATPLGSSPASAADPLSFRHKPVETPVTINGSLPVTLSPSLSTITPDTLEQATDDAAKNTTCCQDSPITQTIKEGAAYFELSEELYQQGLLVAIHGGFYQELLYLLNLYPGEQVILSNSPSVVLAFLESQKVQELIKSYKQELKKLNEEPPNSSLGNLSPYAPLLALAQQSGQLSSMQGLIFKLSQQLSHGSSIPWISATLQQAIDSGTLFMSDLVDLTDLRSQIQENLKNSFVHLQEAECRVQTLRLCGWHFLEGEMASLCQVLKMPRQIPEVQQTIQSELQNTSGVRTLDLSRVDLKKGDVQQLAEMLKVNRSLTSLILAECKLNDNDVRILVNALENSNTSLIRIDLSHNPQVTVDSAQRLLALVQTGHIPLQKLELDGNTQIVFWTRQIQKALEVTDSHLANNENQAERNFLFAVQEENRSLEIFANTAPVREGSVSDEATLTDELARQQALNKKEQDDLSVKITQFEDKSGFELELSQLKQKVRDLENYYDELAYLCEAKRQRYQDQQEFRKQGQENLWVYYCTLAQRMEEIFIASKAESSELMAKTTMAGNFKNAALGITLASKAIGTIVKLSEEVLKGVAVIGNVAEWLNEKRQHNAISHNISRLGSLSDCKKAAYYVARHLTNRYAGQCLQISQDPTRGRIKQTKELLETTILAKKISSPIVLFAECAVQRMLSALMADCIKVPNNDAKNSTQEISEWLGEQLVDEVSKPLTETGTLANKVSLAGESLYQRLCAWFALNTIQTTDGREWIISQVYTHAGIFAGERKFIDYPFDNKAADGKKPKPRTNHWRYDFRRGTEDEAKVLDYRNLQEIINQLVAENRLLLQLTPPMGELPVQPSTSNDQPSVNSVPIASEFSSAQATTTDQPKAVSVQPPISCESQAQANHSSVNLSSQRTSSIPRQYVQMMDPMYWYQDVEVNRLLRIVSGDQDRVVMAQTPFIEVQTREGVPCREANARYIQFFEDSIRNALEKGKPTLIPINTISTVITSGDHGLPVQGIGGVHWTLLVLQPNQNERHRPDIQYIDPFGNGSGEDRDMIKDAVNINDPDFTQSHSYRILNLIKKTKTKHQQIINPKTFIVTGLQQQDNGLDCGPYLIENAIAVLNKQKRVTTNIQTVRERHVKWLQDEDDVTPDVARAKITSEAPKLAATQVPAQSTSTADTAKQWVIPAASSSAKVGETRQKKSKGGGKHTAANTEPSPQKAFPSSGSSTESKNYASPTASSTNQMSNDVFLQFVRTVLENFKSKLKKDLIQILDNLNKTLSEEIKEKIKNEISADLKSSVEKQLQGLIESLQAQGLGVSKNNAIQKNESNEVVNAHQLNSTESKLSELEMLKETRLSTKGIEELCSLQEKIDKVDSKVTTEQQWQDIKKSLQAEFEKQLQKQIEELKKQFQVQLESEEKASLNAINELQNQLILEKAAHDSETVALKKQLQEQGERIQRLEQALNMQPVQEFLADVRQCVERPVALPPELPANQAIVAAPSEIVVQQNDQQSITEAITLGFQTMKSTGSSSDPKMAISRRRTI
jgi:Ulp1 protease family, C-terminal catalytic domain